MVDYKKFELDNGLTVIHHHDETTSLVALNLLYKVGARDENPKRTGFAHLFEHLMFGGTNNIPDFDTPLQMSGGENNAFTNNDYTNYYLTLPKDNVETGFWLEADRMRELAFTSKSLEVQRQVVIEEFKQRYLNQPYGDVWLLLRPLAYKKHPYQWPTIGKEISHIEEATLDEVKAFFYSFYAPNNAVLTVAGNITFEETKELCEKWFGELPYRELNKPILPIEPKQTEKRVLEVKRDVPFDMIYKTWHMCERNHPEFYAYDLISDVLSNGRSARLYQRLVKERQIFSDINAYLTGDNDEGLFVVNGKLMGGRTMEEAEKAIDEELEKMCTEFVSDYELEKVRNKVEATLLYSETNVLNKAMNLSFFEFLGDVAMVNMEVDNYRKVTREDILRISKQLFRAENCSILYYLSNTKSEN